MGKHKRGICMADGGITKETPDQLMARMTAKYGAPSSGSAQQPVPQPAAPPVQQAPAKPQQGPGSGIFGILKGRSAQIDKASGYANGGIVSGKGTPTSDDVPVTIKGEQYNLSDTEAVLPSKTRQALGELLGAKPGDVAMANKLVEQFIQQTNGKPPVPVNEGTDLAAGGLLDEEARRMSYQKVAGVAAPTPTPQPAAQPETSGWGIGKSGFGSNVQVTTGDAARLPAPVVQQGINAMRGQMAPPQPAAVAGSNYVGNGPTDPDTNGRNVIAQPSGAVGRGIATMRGQLNQNPAMSENAIASAAGVSHLKSLYPAGTFEQATQAPAQNTMALGARPMGAEEESIRAKNAAVMNSQLSAADPVALAALAAKKQGRDPSGLITAESAASSIGNPMNRRGGIAGSIDMAGVNGIMERENAARQSMIDSQRTDNQPGGGIAINSDGGIEAANAEKTARWRQDELLSAAKYGNRAAGDAIQANARMAGDQMQGAVAMRGQDVTSGIAARGQDLAAQTEGNRLAVDSPLKRAQAQSIMAQTDSAQMLADIQKKALAGDQQAIATYRALTGKGSESMRDNFMAVGGGQEFDQTANVMRNVPQRLIDLRTGQEVGGPAKQQHQAPAAAIEYLKKNPSQSAAFKAKYGYLPEGA